MGAMTSQITSLTIVYSTVYSGADQRKHQSSPSLTFVWAIHQWLVNSLHKGPVTRKMFPFDDVIMVRQGRIIRPPLGRPPIHFNQYSCRFQMKFTLPLAKVSWSNHHILTSQGLKIHDRNLCLTHQLSSSVTNEIKSSMKEPVVVHFPNWHLL